MVILNHTHQLHFWIRCRSLYYFHLDPLKMYPPPRLYLIPNQQISNHGTWYLTKFISTYSFTQKALPDFMGDPSGYLGLWRAGSGPRIHRPEGPHLPSRCTRTYIDPPDGLSCFPLHYSHSPSTFVLVLKDGFQEDSLCRCRSGSAGSGSAGPLCTMYVTTLSE
jgi:hypothetical protein